jgi:hypothetical protein
MRMVSLALIVLLGATPGNSEEKTVIVSPWSGVTIDGEPVSPPSGNAALVRPYDDSDHEMQGLAQSLLVPCETAPLQPCEDARQRYESGGDRLARYYMRQWEEGIEEGYKPDYGIFEYIGYTRSPVGFQFLVNMYMTDSIDPLTRQWVARGLLRAKNPAAIDLFLECLDDPSTTREGETICVNGIGWTLRDTGVDRPDAVGRLKEIRDAPPESGLSRDDKRWRAGVVLRELEEAGLIDPE